MAPSKPASSMMVARSKLSSSQVAPTKPASSVVAPKKAASLTGAKQPRKRTTKQEGQANKTGRQGSRPRPPPKADRERSDHAGVAMSAARGRIEPHQAGDVPHTAPSTTRARSRAQGAVQRRRRVASQEEASEWSSLGCFWPKLRPGSNWSPKTMQQ